MSTFLGVFGNFCTQTTSWSLITFGCQLYYNISYIQLGVYILPKAIIMLVEYKYTMSQEDQEQFINIERSSKYGELLRNIKQKPDSQVNFKEQSSSKFVLSLLDQKIMKKTISAFPVDLYLNNKTIYTFTKAQMRLETTPDRVYDVRFIMPLLYHAVSPSLFVDCRDFIARRCLALTLTGLSSEDPQMRALCYKIIERYYEHLLSTLLIDKQLWINFLDLLKNSIPSPNFRMKFIFTTYMTKIIDVLLHADDKMYELVKEYLTGRPRIDMNTIEIYDDLLLCSDVHQYNNNLRWLITLFRDGIQSKNDLKVVVSLNAIPQAMCLYNSELRFERANETICSMFIRIATVESGAKMLASEYSFLPWLHQIILFHLDQNLEEISNDIKGESLGDTTRSISSLVFTLIDVLMKVDGHDAMSLPRLLELFNVFIVLHDLVIKSKSASVLEYYLSYVRKVAKAVRKDPKIPDKLSGHLLELIKAKMTYLA